MENITEYIKCHFNGRDYQPCKWMLDTTIDVNGNKIGLSITCNVELNDYKEFNGGAVYRWSRNKKDIVYINYCPFCGENIEPRRS